MNASMRALIGQLRAGDRLALARAISLVEAGGKVAEEICRQTWPIARRAFVVGFAGSRGVGKSTLINAYVSKLREHGRTVAVVAIDSPSPQSGGAVLADRTFFARHAEDMGVFIRSVAARGHPGELPASLHRVTGLMDLAGWDVLVIEAPGSSESTPALAGFADVRVVVVAPMQWDEIAYVSAGFVELADILVLNKSDLPLADQFHTALRNTTRLSGEQDGGVPIIRTVAPEGRGIELLVEAIDRATGRMTPDGGDKKIHLRTRRLVTRAAAERCTRLLEQDRSAAIDTLVAKVASGIIDLEAAAGKALGQILHRRDVGA